MKLSVTTDLKGALDKLERAGGNAERFLKKQIQDASRTLVSSSGNVPGLVQITPPFFAGVKAGEAKKAGEHAILGDINKVYVTASGLYGIFKAYGADQERRQYWYLVVNHPAKLPMWLRRNGPAVVQQLKHGWDGGAEHEARRRNGRVTGKWPTVLVLPGEEGLLRAYIKRKQGKVGLLASAVPAAYSGRYGPLKGVPAWAKRHGARWGAFTPQVVSGGFSVRVTLRAPYALRDMQRRFDYALRYRYKAMARSLPHALRAEMRKLR